MQGSTIPGKILECDSEGEAMTSATRVCHVPGIEPPLAFPSSHWYAVQTRARHEKQVAQRFQEQGFPTFLPLISEAHRWSDRKKIVELPLFGCYVFVKASADRETRLKVCRIDGVFRIVGAKGEGAPIPENEIEAIRVITSQQLAWSEHPFLKIGQRIRIRSGALAGVEGILTGRNGDRTLVVSVDAIQRSLAVRIEGYDVEPL
jgi:transcription antitermination factor NusG